MEADALSINIGVISLGKGRVWVDDAVFEIVPPTPQEAAAREDLQKLYDRLDGAMADGKTEEVAALALPDARFGGGVNWRPLPAVLAALKESLGKGTKFTSRTAVTYVRISGDDAAVTTKSESTIEADGVRSAYEGTSRDIWTRTADGWRMKQSFEISCIRWLGKPTPRP